MKKQNVRTLSLIVCTFTYLLIGAAVFDSLESETEKRRWDVLNAFETMVIGKYNISPEDFKVLETVVLKTEPHKAGQQWKFTGAFYYATTVLTTIGYGHSTPCTIGGKLFTMFYAIVGIPLGLVMFQSIGERVNMLSSVIIQSVKRSLNCRQTGASELDLICVVTTLSSLTIAGGAAAFSRFEGWTYFDSVYYCFVTLTTIGFGDMVALQKDNALNRKPSYVIFALVFILFGLAIMAASLNLLVLRFVTMNTEDEKRDEQQAIQALRGAVRLEGDIITADGEILRGVAKGTRLPADPKSIIHSGTPIPSYDDYEPSTSVCSCRCASCFGRTCSPEYHDPLSPVSTVNRKKSITKQNLLTKMPRYIEKSSSKNHSQTLRLNSASGYLYMNAKSSDFQIDSEDFKEMIRKRRQQLLDKSKSALNYDTFSRFNNNDRSSRFASSPSEVEAGFHMYGSHRSSLFSIDARSENEKRSHDPLMDDSSRDDRLSYSKRKIMRNVDRNIPQSKNKKKRNYFHEDTEYKIISDNMTTVCNKKRNEPQNNFDDVCVYKGKEKQKTYTWGINRKSSRKSEKRNMDDVSNDGSFGYYLTNDEEEGYCFVNDTLTFTQPPHRASI